MTTLTAPSVQPLMINTNTGGYVGLCFFGDEVRKQFFRIKCPCGVEASYPLNGLPEVDTKHPCGNPEHWSVKYGPAAGERVA